MSTWYKSGFDAVASEQDALTRRNRPNDFYMRVGETKQLVFVDDEPMTTRQHSYQDREGRYSSMTCLAATETDIPCCAALGQSYLVGMFTVVDCSRVEGKEGKIYQYELKVLPAKLNTLKLLQYKKSVKGGTLINQLYKIFRTGEKTPSCGDNFDYEREITDPKVLFARANYRGKLLSELYAAAVRSPEEMRKLALQFQLPTINGVQTLEMEEDGKTFVPKIYPFNYETFYSPLKPSEARTMLAGVKMKAKKGAATNLPAPPDEDLPF